MGDWATETIKKKLKDMMFDTSVTIVIISPHMKESKWIDWEIEYSLSKISRKNRTSQRNGLVGVNMKINGSYEWIKNTHENVDGCCVSTYRTSYMYDIINNNRHNQSPKQYSFNKCKCVDWSTGSYISLVEEEDFLKNPSKYIDNAFDKSENDASGYDISLS